MSKNKKFGVAFWIFYIALSVPTIAIDQCIREYIKHKLLKRR